MTLTTEAFSLQDLHARVREEDGCLIWTGDKKDGTRPIIWIDGKSKPARRVLYEIVRGPIRGQKRIGVRCGNPLCLHPDHLIARDRPSELRGTTRDAAFKAKIATTKRANSRFTPELVAQIRASDLNNCALGRELGINHQTIAKIRRGEIWKSYSSPFAGLGAL